MRVAVLSSGAMHSAFVSRMRPALACLLLACVLPALAQADPPADESQCPAQSQIERNRDGSLLELRKRYCDGSDEMSATVWYRAKPGAKARELMRYEDHNSPGTWAARLVDFDHDGWFDVQKGGQCGAGPNCEGEIHRFDPKARGLYLMHAGGWADVSFDGEYLVESGRASCCAWEYHVYRVRHRPRPVFDERPDFIILADAGFVSDDKAGESPATRCRFSRRTGEDYRVIAPPAKRWLEYCSLYGDDYVVEPPEPVAGKP